MNEVETGQPPVGGGVLAGGGEMGERTRAFDWSRTALGPVENWPQSLKTSVSTCLNSRFAIVLWWGKELVVLYNDAYASILGIKHPQALGTPGKIVWHEIWHIIEPMLQGVMERGEATWSDNLLLEIERSGYPEELYFTFSYSPIRDESGGVGGIFTPVQETTAEVIGQRRLRTFGDLAREARAANAQSSEEVCEVASQTLAKNLHDIPFAAFYLFSEDGKEAHLAGTSGISSSIPLIPEVVRIDEAIREWPFAAMVRSGRTGVVELPSEIVGVPCGAWPVPPRDVLVYPISPGGQRTGFALLAVSPRKHLDEEYRDFLSLIGGHVTTAIAEARALEEERRRAAALAELDRAKTAFFSNVSHEFRTPLTLMLGPLEEILGMDGALSPAITERATVTHRNALRLQRLVNTLLDFSRIEAGRVEAVYEPTDLAGFTADLASTFRSAMEKAGLEFNVRCPPLREPVHVDRDMWEKVVLNLVSNAFKYTLEGGVTVKIEERGGCAVFSLIDTGTGIPESELPHLFERFHRVEGARGRTQEGTGIGLALVAELVKLHGGTVGVRSAAGKGSEFTVTIPFGVEHLPRERRGAGPDSPLRADASAVSRRSTSTALRADLYVEEALRWLPGRTSVAATDGGVSAEDFPVRVTRSSGASRNSGGRILLADDNADMRDYVARLLKAEQYEVETVANGNEALECVLDHPPDLVLSDVMMPGLDGFGLVRAVRTNPKTQALPVILLSARAGEEARVDGLGAGASDYLVKPFTARELLARVGAHLEMGRFRQRAAEREAALLTEAEAARDEVVKVLHSITDAFAVFDREWRFTYVNAEAERLLGMPREQLLGKNHWELFPATLGTIVEQEYRRATRERVSVEFETFYEPWQRWFAIKGYPTEDGGLSNYFRDVTEQKRTEAIVREQDALREADRRRWHELFFQLPAAVAIFRGPDHVFGYANGEYCRLAGRNSGELYGKSLRDVSPEIGRQGYFELLDNVYRTGTAYSAKEALIQLDVRGDGVLQDLYFNFICHPTMDDAGRIDGIFLHAVDVTDLVTARKHIEESEEWFRQIAESMPQVVWSATADGVCDYVNARWTELTGCDLAATVAGEFRRRMLPEDLAVMDAALGQGLRSGKPYSFECRFWRVSDGTLCWYLIRAIPVRDPKGEIVKWLGTSTDIDEKMRAAEALAQVNRDLMRANVDLEQFGYSASHDLQEPLRNVIICSELLSNRYADKLDGQALELLQFLQNGATRMESLVRDLLEYTHVNKWEESEETDSALAMADALANLANTIEETGAKVTSDALPIVRVHKVHLQQLFQNTIGNALKYRSEQPPVIHITAERRDAQWRFSVKDNGIGIDPQYHQRIFGLFKRLHTGAQYSGTGIGLAICQRIVDQYDGRIWVESEVGKGSTFYFTLPIEVAQRSTQAMGR